MNIPYLFTFIIKTHAFFGLPAMTLKEIAIYKKIFLSINREDELNIFEYGSGYSTVYFAGFLKKRLKRFHIHSIDNSVFWHSKVSQMIAENNLEKEVMLYVEIFPPFWEKKGWNRDVHPACGQFPPALKEEFNYINKPLELGIKFDIMIVDGRFRRRCLEVVSDCLSEDGIVFLHDAQKMHYQGPFNLYHYSNLLPSGKFYPLDPVPWKMWLGSHNNSTVMDY